MAGGGGRDRDRMNPNPKKPPYGGPLAASPGNSGPYVPEQPGQKPTPQVRPQRPPILQGPPMTQTPPFVPQMPQVGKPGMGTEILQAEKPQMSMPLPPGKPAWQILAENGQKGLGSAAANRAAVRGLPAGTGTGPGAGVPGAPPDVFSSLPAGAQAAGVNGRPGGIDGAIQALRAQLGQPEAGADFPYRIGTPEVMAQANANGGVRRGMAGFPKPPGGLGGPGSDLGFQSGGGLLAPTFPPGDGAGPGNPYLDILRQRLGASNPGAMNSVTRRYAY